MAQRPQPIQPRDSIIELARTRRRKPGKWWDFSALIDDQREVPEPVYFMRSDGLFLFYHGKENVIYGETEAGKDMMLGELTCQAVEFSIPVAWIDFEEGTEVDAGRRLLELGISPEVLSDKSLFLFATPEDVEQARDAIHDAIRRGSSIIIINGIQAAYSTFGWDISDPDSASEFRKTIVLPCRNAGCTIIATDHIPKEATKARGNGSRYAYGGVMKLNWVNGAAYLLRARKTITRGKKGNPGEGTSDLILTKDRPGNIKPYCRRIDDDARTMYAGTLNVKSTGWGGRCRLSWQDFVLRVDVDSPMGKQYPESVPALPYKRTVGRAKTQSRIYDILSEAGRPMTPAEITSILNRGLDEDDDNRVSRQSVKDALRRGKDNEIFIEAGNGQWKHV